ncbi:MAG TPA: hypothetical protein VMR52_00570 [Dehalococcoidia bacterium]|nr:hypothetical protein [Dehalococcoidia bacterium]
MPSVEASANEQQKRNNIHLVLQRAGISVDAERLASLARAVDANRLATDAVARIVAGDRPPAVFRAPEPRPDA